MAERPAKCRKTDAGSDLRKPVSVVWFGSDRFIGSFPKPIVTDLLTVLEDIRRATTGKGSAAARTATTSAALAPVLPSVPHSHQCCHRCTTRTSAPLTPAHLSHQCCSHQCRLLTLAAVAGGAGAGCCFSCFFCGCCCCCCWSHLCSSRQTFVSPLLLNTCCPSGKRIQLSVPRLTAVSEALADPVPSTLPTRTVSEAEPLPQHRCLTMLCAPRCCLHRLRAEINCNEHSSTTHTIADTCSLLWPTVYQTQLLTTCTKHHTHHTLTCLHAHTSHQPHPYRSLSITTNHC